MTSEYGFSHGNESLLPPHVLKNRAELEGVSRQGAQTAYLGDNRMLCRALGKYLMYADTQDISLTPHLAMDGFWESWVTIAMARIIQPGWQCVDVGANLGYYSLLMGDGVGMNGSVVAVEPNPQVASLLRSTLRVNGLEHRVSVLDRAIHSIDNARVTLVVPQDSPMNASLGSASSDAVSVEVKTRTLDVLTQDWRSVDLIKIDAEGSEWAIWQGMSSTIRSNPRITVIMEVNPTRKYDTELFLESIKNAGFPIRYIDPGSNIVHASNNQIINSNHDWMLFLQQA